jgi:hypothetical protein
MSAGHRTEHAGQKMAQAGIDFSLSCFIHCDNSDTTVASNSCNQAIFSRPPGWPEQSDDPFLIIKLHGCMFVQKYGQEVVAQKSLGFPT